jgi:hypothetical protein
MRQELKFIRRVAAEHGTEVVIVRWKGNTGAQIGAALRGSKRVIKLNVLNRTPNEVIKSFFHELGHVYCMNHKIYPAFHGLKGWVPFMKASVLHGLQAERYVDELGRMIMAQYLPPQATGRIQKAYNNQEEVWTFKFNLVLPRYMELVKRGVFGRAA